MSDGRGLKETINYVSDAIKGGPSLGDVGKNIGTNFKSWSHNLAGNIHGGWENFTHSFDDNIVIPANTTTLTGKPFASLYESGGMKLGDVKTTGMTTTGGQDMKQLVVDGKDGTEMVSANLSSGVVRSYDTLTLEQRAAYEIVLLSKLYASKYVPGEDFENTAYGKKYAEEMAAYSKFCTDYGISWQSVMQTASWELQSQSLEYAEDAKGLYNPGKSEKLRVAANKAHTMLLGCGEWEDSLLPHLSGRIAYEDTLDMDEQSVTWYRNIWNWFSGALGKVKDVITSPWRAVKASVPGLLDTAEAIADAEEQHQEERREEWRQNAEAAKETVSDVKDKAGDLANQASEYLGLNSSGTAEDGRELGG